MNNQPNTPSPSPGGWRSAKGKFARRMALGRHWKKRWQAEPEFMRASLNKMIAGNKERWAEKERRIRAFAQTLPETMKSWEFKATIKARLHELGQTGSTQQVHRVYVAMIRKRIFVLGDDGITWTVAKSA